MPTIDKYNEVLIGVIAGIIIFLVITSMVVFILLFYQKKKFQHIKQITDIEKKFSEELLKSQIEIQEETFNHLSSELHDNVGQVLSLAKIQIGIMKEKGETGGGMLDDVKDNIGKALTDLRDIAKSLSSERLKGISIDIAVKNEIDRISKSGILQSALIVKGVERNIDGHKKLILFRIVQESLQNIIKHASAEHVTIQFSYLPQTLETIISDDGKGFNPELEFERSIGLGLNNIKTRTALTGGTSSINSEPGSGTTIIINIPYE